LTKKWPVEQNNAPPVDSRERGSSGQCSASKQQVMLSTKRGKDRGPREPVERKNENQVPQRQERGRTMNNRSEKRLRRGQEEEGLRAADLQ